MLSRSVRGRPTLAAAAVYTLLALVLVGPGLVPGRTLSASDYLWWAAPWQQVAPAGATGEIGLGSNYEMADAALVFQPMTEWARGRSSRCGTRTSWAAGRSSRTRSRRCSRRSRGRRSCCRSGGRSGWSATLKLVTAAMGTFLLAPRARDALRGRADGRARVRLRAVLRRLAAVAADAACGRGCRGCSWACTRVVRRPGRAAGRGAGAGRGAPVLRRAPGVELPRARRSPACSRCCADAGRAARRPPWAACSSALLAGRRSRRSRSCRSSSCWPTRPTSASARASDPPARRALPARLRAARSTGAARRSSADRPFMVARAFYAGALPLMLAAWAVVAAADARAGGDRGGGRGRAGGRDRRCRDVFEVVDRDAGLRRGPQHAAGDRLAAGVALLAGWGLDDGSVARWRCSSVSRSSCCRWSSRWSSATALPCGEALEVAGLRDADRCRRAAARLCCSGVPAPRSRWRCAASAVARGRRRGARAGGARPAAGRDGQNPAIPRRPRRAAGHAGDRARCRGAPARFAGLRAGLGLAAAPAGPGDALRALRRARLRLSGRAPLRHAVAPRGRAARASSSRSRRCACAPDDEALRALGLLGVTDVIQPPAEAPRARLGDHLRRARRAALRQPARRAARVGGRRPAGRRRRGRRARRDPRARLRRHAHGGRRAAARRAGGAGEGEARDRRATSPSASSSRRPPTAARSSCSPTCYIPGWQATVDGREAPIERVDYLLRGVAVDAGEHRVELGTGRRAGGSAGS